ncbi:transforming growth factor beta-1-induced transcript 1 protein-like [Arctopsyche grandis]|uniref:transforming growth factor beta-1-induced transcript 1 protein-like n=1 Tax=Arctopsyche grandis TaxID=121162 RepID=UPI00406D8D9A
MNVLIDQEFFLTIPTLIHTYISICFWKIRFEYSLASKRQARVVVNIGEFSPEKLTPENMASDKNSRHVIFTMGKDICNVCFKEIEGRVVTALDKKWHPEHFTCADCKKPIENSTFHQKDGKIYCETDFLNNHTDKCNDCGKPIKDRIIKAMGVCWHEEHFVCKKCKKPFGDLPFTPHEGKPYCKKCHTELFAPKCGGCKKPIENNTIIALNNNWHRDCFKCGKCSKPVTESTFSVEGGKPLCGKC